MEYQNDIYQIISLLTSIGLNEYQASAISYLLVLGETKATTLSQSSGIPTARIYDILKDLVKKGLVTKKHGKPQMYRSRPPEEIISILMAIQRNNLRKNIALLESKAKDFTDIAYRIYLKGSKGAPTVPLFRAVSVGDSSLEETRKLYDVAKEEILIFSKALEYFPLVSENLKAALERGVSIKIILVSPEVMELKDREKQKIIVESIKRLLGKSVMFRFSDEVPIRGSIVDPNREGRAIFLVEDPGIPFFLRELAITSHYSFVKGLAIMFNLIWEYKSKQLEK